MRLKKFWCILVTIAMVASLFTGLTPVFAADTTEGFTDDFESYAEGEPSAPWEYRTDFTEADFEKNNTVIGKYNVAGKSGKGIKITRYENEAQGRLMQMSRTFSPISDVVTAEFDFSSASNSPNYNSFILYAGHKAVSELMFATKDNRLQLCLREDDGNWVDAAADGGYVTIKWAVDIAAKTVSVSVGDKEIIKDGTVNSAGAGQPVDKFLINARQWLNATVVIDNIKVYGSKGPAEGSTATQAPAASAQPTASTPAQTGDKAGFTDDFESYAEGAPSAPWEYRNDFPEADSEKNNTVFGKYNVAGKSSKGIKITRYENEAQGRLMQLSRTFSPISDVVTAEFDFSSASYSTNYNSFILYAGDKVVSELAFITKDDRLQLTLREEGTWVDAAAYGAYVTIKWTVDIAAKTASVSVGDKEIIKDIPVNSAGAGLPVDKFLINARQWLNATVVIDNVKVYGAAGPVEGDTPTASAQPTATATPTPAPVVEGAVVEKEPYQDMLDTLQALGIVPETLAGTDQAGNMTRGAFTAILCGLYNYPVELTATKTQFTDVPESHAYAASIQKAKELGLVNGTSETTFAPDENITYEQAIKLIMTALGYNDMAEQLGGYYFGHVSLASREKLVTGINVQVGQPATFGDLVRMLYNALEVDLMQEVGIGSYVEYTTIRGETILTERHKVFKADGVVTANHLTGLTRESNLKETIIEMDHSERYFVGSTNAADYLGYTVTYYATVRESATDDSTIVYISLKRNANDIYYVLAEDIEDVSLTEFSYMASEDDSEPERLILSPVMDVIYNGKVGVDYTAADLKPEIGDVTLVDRDNDGSIDVVFVNSAITFVVDRVSSQENILYNKLNTPAGGEGVVPYIEADRDSDEYELEILKDGEEIELTALREWDVVSVVESKNRGERLLRLLVSSETVDGTVEEIISGEDELVVDGTRYKLASPYLRAVESDNLSVSSYRPGDSVSLLLDTYGNVVFVRTDEMGTLQYGYYLMPGDYDTMGEEAKVKILAADGTWLILEGANKIIMNEATVRELSDDTLAGAGLMRMIGGELQPLPQLVRYRLNGSGQLAEIQTVQAQNVMDGMTNEQQETIIKSGVFRRSYSQPRNADGLMTSTNEEGLYCRTGYKAFLEKNYNSKIFFYYSDSTPFFRAPYDANGNLSVLLDESQYWVFGQGSLWNGGGFQVEVYDEDIDSVAGAIVRYQAGGGSGSVEINNQSIKIIDTISEAVVDGEPRIKLSVLDNGNPKEYYAEDLNLKADGSEITLGDLRRGDVIWVGTTKEGLVGAFKVYVSNGEPITSVMSFGFDGGKNDIVTYGEIIRMSADKTKVQFDIGGEIYKITFKSPAVVIVDEERPSNQLRTTTINELNVGDKLVMRISNDFNIQCAVRYDYLEP